MVPEIIDMDMPVEGVFHNLVIVKIKKDFAGQAQKVMNAMWGAGQMMFNKILVLVDENIRIQDYAELAKYVFRNLNPAIDIYFSQGPMDVLDHSCSKLGFGGKMCIDGTGKFEEELDENFQWTIGKGHPDSDREPIDELKLKFPEIREMNKSLLQRKFRVLIISIEKNRKGMLKNCMKKFATWKK